MAIRRIYAAVLTAAIASAITLIMFPLKASAQEVKTVTIEKCYVTWYEYGYMNIVDLKKVGSLRQSEKNVVALRSVYGYSLGDVKPLTPESLAELVRETKRCAR